MITIPIDFISKNFFPIFIGLAIGIFSLLTFQNITADTKYKNSQSSKTISGKKETQNSANACVREPQKETAQIMSHCEAIQVAGVDISQIPEYIELQNKLSDQSDTLESNKKLLKNSTRNEANLKDDLQNLKINYTEILQINESLKEQSKMDKANIQTLINENNNLKYLIAQQKTQLNNR